MNKRTFIKAAAVLTAEATMPQLFSCKTKAALPRTNWAGNLTYSTDNLFTPVNITALQDTIKRCKKIRGLGTTHCFNKIADRIIISLNNLKYFQ